MKIGFLGQGAMGTRMAARLQAAGHAVTVWNRTQVPGGAASVALAVAGADAVIASLRDDAASAAVWQEALPVMAPGALGIETSTLGPGTVRRLHDRAMAGGIHFLDAPVAGSRPQAEAGQLIFMVGGQAEALVRAEPLLLTMGGAVHHAGGPGAGAAVKLMLNSLFAAQLAVTAELIGMAGVMGVDAARAVEIIGATPVASPAVKGAAAAMLAGAFAPAFPIDLVAKDMALALGTKARLPVIEAVAGVYDAAMVEGLAQDNITGIVQRYVRR
jgi:3-hydroxyisobutyrate dehydrogenase